MNGRTLLMLGLGVCVLGLVFGLVIYSQLKNLPVHASMREISELIYETCKTYLITQGKFILLLEVFIGVIMILYFGFLLHFEASRVAHHPALQPDRHRRQLRRGVVRHPDQHLRQLAHRLRQPQGRGRIPVYAIPLKAGMSIGMLLISVELFLMLCILLFIPGDYAGPCFIGFAIGESLGAAALRIAGGIFTKIADIGSDLMKIVFNIKEDDARNPGVIADCTGDNAGDSVGPSADGFETYGVTGVALISFILLAVKEPAVQVQLLVWIFMMRVLMIVASGASYLINEAIARGRYAGVAKMNFEAPLTSLVWLTSIVSVVITYVASYILIPNLGDGTLWWKLSTVITCGTLAGAIIPELVKVFTSTESGHVREVVTASREGGASLNVLSGFVAGNFSAYWLGIVIVVLMGLAYLVEHHGTHGRPDGRPRGVRVRPGRLRLPRHGTGDDRGRLLRSGHRQRPVGVRAVPDRRSPQRGPADPPRVRLRREVRDGQGAARGERRRRQHLQGHRQAGADRHGRRRRHHHDLLDHRGADLGAHREPRQAVAARTRRSCWA